MQDIPVIASNAWYDLTVPLSQADGSIVTTVFEFRYNFFNTSWYMSLTQDNVELVTGVRIVLGTYLGSRCRAQFFRRNVLVAIDTSGKGREATFDDFGTRVVLRHFTVYEVITGRGLTIV